MVFIRLSYRYIKELCAKVKRNKMFKSIITKKHFVNNYQFILYYQAKKWFKELRNIISRSFTKIGKSNKVKKSYLNKHFDKLNNLKKKLSVTELTNVEKDEVNLEIEELEDEIIELEAADVCNLSSSNFF